MNLPTGTKRQHDLTMVGLSLAVAGLIAASLVAFAMWTHDLPNAGMAMLLFDLDQEQNIPTWFSTVLLAYLALAAWRLAPTFSSTNGRLAGLALGAGFLALSADEAAMLHERIGGVVEVEGALSNARWILLWLPLGGVAGLAVLAMLWKQSPRLTAGMLVGALVYLTGAVGVETVNQVNRHKEAVRLEQAGIQPSDTRQFSRQDERYGNDTLVYAAGTAVEEGLENSGILIWCAALLAAHRRAAQAPAPARERAASAERIAEPKPSRAPREPVHA